MTQALLTLLFGLASSLCWGSGDFFGGLASRRARSTGVVFVSYLIGMLLLSSLALAGKEALPSPSDIFWGALAGLVGVIGLTLFYRALAIGHMGIIAPVSAVLTAALPVLFSAITETLPGLLQVGGFLLALVAIVLIARPERTRERPKGLGLAMLAGCGFGCFFICISRVQPGETFWPLAIARLVSVLSLFVLALLRRESVLPGKSVGWLVVLAGVLDAAGNAFFVEAVHHGRLDIASILASLYPAATVVLAALVLRERITIIQALGVLLALLAIPLIAF